MKKFIKFECHDYMDMKPHYDIQVMSEEKAKEYAKYMNENYSGGTTRFHSVLTAKEVEEFIIKEIKKPNFHCNSVDLEWFAKVTKLFVECYLND